MNRVAVIGHGTGTERGDTAETQATRQAFDRAVPFSSIKGHTGHTLGACGALDYITGGAR